jgi:hypothetical protein
VLSLQILAASHNLGGHSQPRIGHGHKVATAMATGKFGWLLPNSSAEFAEPSIFFRSRSSFCVHVRVHVFVCLRVLLFVCACS